IGPAYSLQGHIYVPVDISNYKQEQLNDFLLSIPVSTNIKEIISSGPLQVEDTADNVGTSNKKRIRLSGIDASQVTRLLVPIANENEVGNVEAVNAKQMKLSLLMSKNLASPTQLAIKEVLITTTLNTVLLSIALLWFNERLKDLLAKSEKRREEIIKE